MIDVKTNMKAIQLELGLSNKECAAKMKKMSEQNYWNWFNISKKSSFEFVLEWCDALHVPVYYVFTYPVRYVTQEQFDERVAIMQTNIDSLIYTIQKKDDEIDSLKKKISKERPMQAV